MITKRKISKKNSKQLPRSIKVLVDRHIRLGNFYCSKRKINKPTRIYNHLFRLLILELEIINSLQDKLGIEIYANSFHAFKYDKNLLLIMIISSEGMIESLFIINSNNQK